MALKLIFMGTPEFAVPILKTIHNSEHKILCVYTQPPKKKNRGQKIYSSPVQQFAERFNLKLRCPSNLNEEEYQHIKTLKPEIVIVVAYGKILPKKILDVGTGSGCIIVSLLKERPKCIATAIDISKNATNVAKTNAKLHQLENKINFMEIGFVNNLDNKIRIT